MTRENVVVILGLLAFLALVGVVVYFAVNPAASPQRSSLRSSEPTPSGANRYLPVLTPQAPLGPGPRKSAPAPAFTAPRLDRKGQLSLSDLRGKGVVMNFFASWCAPCRAEAKDLEGTYQKHRSRGIVFLGVDIEQDTWDEALAFVEEFGITYPAVRDSKGEIAEKYQMFGLPTTVFIDKDGIIRSKFVGPFLGQEGLKELERRIKEIMP